MHPKTMLLRRRLIAYADYCIAFKRLAQYKDFAAEVGMTPANLHIADQLAWLAEYDAMMGRPLRSSIFVRQPETDDQGVIIKHSVPGKGYFDFCNQNQLIKQPMTGIDFWKEQLRNLGYVTTDVHTKYGIIL